MSRFFGNQLPVSARAARTVRDILVQPSDHIVNALGEHPMAAPWPAGTTVWAKTGAATDKSGKAVTWLIGRVERDGHGWLFVSCVIGSADGMAAVNQAGTELKRRRVLSSLPTCPTRLTCPTCLVLCPDPPDPPDPPHIQFDGRGTAAATAPGTFSVIRYKACCAVR